MGHLEAACPVWWKAAATERQAEAAKRKAGREARQARAAESRDAFLEREAARTERQAAAKAQKDKRAKQLSAFLEREAQRKAAAKAAADQESDNATIKFGEIASSDKDADADASSESTAATLSFVAATCESEDREARKLQKKLREISKLQEREARGERLDSLQLKKIDQKITIEVAFERTLARTDAKARGAQRRSGPCSQGPGLLRGQRTRRLARSPASGGGRAVQGDQALAMGCGRSCQMVCLGTLGRDA